ncbi:MAG: DUF4340 domain-containing protein [Gemmatimonadota bacterium]
MKRRQLYVILGILALGLLVYAPRLVRDSGQEPPAPVVISLEPLGGETPARIRVTGAAEGDTVRLEASTAGWVANGHPADSFKVADLLAALDTLAVRELVARNPRNHERLGVTEASGHRVELSGAGGGKVVFLLGNRDDATHGYHVRLPGAPEVYLLPGPAGAALRRTLDEWRDHAIARLDTARVREIVVRREGEKLVLSRGEDGWSLDGASADSAKVRSLLDRLAHLDAMGFPTDSAAAAADFDAPDGALEAFVQEEGDVTGRALALSLRLVRGEEESSPWLVRRADGEVFRLSSYTIGGLLPTREELTGG